MKKLFAFVSCIFLVNMTLWAQDETSVSEVSSDVPYTVDASELYLKDDMLFGINFYGGHGKDENILNGTTFNETSYFNVMGSMQGGYFIFDRFAIGLGLNLDVNYVSFDSGEEVTNVDLFGGPFVRIYLVDKLYLNLLGGYGISNMKEESGTSVINTNFNGLYATGGLGYDIFLNTTKDIALEIGANYVFKKLVNTDNGDLEIQTGAMNYNIGLIFYFF